MNFLIMKSEKKLSDRELQVLQLISEGCSTKDIALRLEIKVRTVESHRRNINGKLDAHHAAEAIHKARALKLI
jgi:DNA-binding CsgD family transcriptional regulator